MKLISTPTATSKRCAGRMAQYADQATELKIVMLPIRDSDYCTLSARLVDYRGNGIADETLPDRVAAQTPWPQDPFPPATAMKKLPCRCDAIVRRPLCGRAHSADGEFTFEKFRRTNFCKCYITGDTISERSLGGPRQNAARLQAVDYDHDHRRQRSTPRSTARDCPTPKPFISIRTTVTILAETAISDPSQSSFDFDKYRRANTGGR